jgi:hypothetical protein
MMCYTVDMMTIPRLREATMVAVAASACLTVEVEFRLDLFSLSYSSYCRSSGCAPQCWEHFWQKNLGAPVPLPTS